MIFRRAVDQSETGAKLLMQRIGIVAHHIKAAALLRPFRTKRRDNHISTRLHGPGNLSDVGGSILGSGEKVKNGTVMPQVVILFGQLRTRNVPDQPGYPAPFFARSRSGHVDRGSGYIQDTDIPITFGEQIVDESRFAPTNIDDRRGMIRSNRFDERKRAIEMLPIPAHGVCRLRLVDGLPMRLACHNIPGSRIRLRLTKSVSSIAYGVAVSLAIHCREKCHHGTAAPFANVSDDTPGATSRQAVGKFYDRELAYSPLYQLLRPDLNLDGWRLRIFGHCNG
jgi:hypothetical protein